MSGENAAGAAVEPGSRNGAPGDPEATGATGASQGLLDRKEVLGGEFSVQWVGRWRWAGAGLSLSLAGPPLNPQEQPT